jgi:hypothetical protein
MSSGMQCSVCLVRREAVVEHVASTFRVERTYRVIVC